MAAVTAGEGRQPQALRRQGNVRPEGRGEGGVSGCGEAEGRPFPR